MDEKAQEKIIASVLLDEGVMRSEVAADMVALAIRQRLDAHRKLPEDKPPLLSDEKVKQKLGRLWQDPIGRAGVIAGVALSQARYEG